MEENDGLPGEEEFIELINSMTDEERIEIFRKLADFARENPEACQLTAAEIAENAAKLERYAQAVADKKRVGELKRKTEIALKTVEDRINARIADTAVTESPDFFDTTKNNKSH